MIVPAGLLLYLRSMLILTNFDYNKHPPLPLATVIITDDFADYKPLFLNNTGLKLSEIWDNITTIKNVIEGCHKFTIFINDFKAHVAAFKLDRRTDYMMSEVKSKIGQLEKPTKEDLLAAAKDDLDLVKESQDKSRGLVANVSVVYQSLEDRGVFNGYKHVYPKYSMNTLSGRSKTTGFNIQGSTDKQDIRHTDKSFRYFVHFDWISADLFMIAIISGDNDLLSMFKDSDPYTEISKSLNITRGECKKELLQAIYSLSIDHPLLAMFPMLKEWMKGNIDFLDENGYVETLLGRRFYLGKNNRRGIFNSQFQGSVVHALHSVMARSFEDYGYNLVTEMHDSLIFACNRNSISVLVKEIGALMLRPFVELEIRIPYVVSVGTQWRRWKVYKTERWCGQVTAHHKTHAGAK